MEPPGPGSFTPASKSDSKSDYGFSISRNGRQTRSFVYLNEWIESLAVPLAQQCGGFQGYLIVVLREEPRIILIVSFWNSLEDAERFESDTFPQVGSIMLPFVEGDIHVRTFVVAAGTKTGPDIKGHSKKTA